MVGYGDNGFCIRRGKSVRTVELAQSLSISVLEQIAAYQNGWIGSDQLGEVKWTGFVPSVLLGDRCHS